MLSDGCLSGRIPIRTLNVTLLPNAKDLVVCFCVTALALMSSAGLADLIQIDDLGESIAVSFTSTGFGSIGTITNTGESVVIPYTLIGSVWGGNTFIAIQLIDPAESDELQLRISGQLGTRLVFRRNAS